MSNYNDINNLSYVLDTRSMAHSSDSDTPSGSSSVPPIIPDVNEDDESIRIIEVNQGEAQQQQPVILEVNQGEAQQQQPAAVAAAYPINNDSLALAIIPDRSVVPSFDGIIEYRYEYPPGVDVVVLKIADYNPRYMHQFNNLRQFFNEDEVLEGCTNITAFLARSELISMNNVFTCNKDSMALRIDLPEGFIDYMSEAANEAEENIVDMGKYNLYNFEKMIKENGDTNANDQCEPTTAKRRRTMVSSNKCVKNLPLRGSKMISTFDGKIELEKPLSACRAWFSGILESKSVMSASKKPFASFFLRPNEMQTLTYINGELRNDDYMQITKAIYITAVASPFRLYTLNSNRGRISRMETSMDSLKDKEVYIEFTNMEVTLLNSLRVLVKGVVKRVIDLEWITNAQI